MRGVLSRAVVFTGVVAACAAAAAFQVRAQDAITVRAARVVDGKGAVLQNSTVEIRDGKIVTVDQRQGTVTYDLGDVTLMPGMNYNKWFTGHQIGMAQPLSSEGQVEYTDGTKPTVDQMVKDVAQFLTWAAEPELEQRKALGVKLVLFLTVLGGLAYAVKRKVWADVH